MSAPIRTYLAHILGVEEMMIDADDDRIDEILRRRLTKKERRLLNQSLQQHDTETIMASLGVDSERFEAIQKALVQKIRHPKIRNELVSRTDG